MSRKTTDKEKPGGLIDVLVMTSIFMNSLVLLRSPAEIYLSYIPILILLPVLILKYGISPLILKIFLPIFLMGIVYVIVGENTLSQFLKISLGFGISILFYQLVFELYSKNISHLFKIYLISCYFIAIIGIIQLIAWHLGISPLYRFSWILNKWGVSEGGLGIRVNSIFSEPSYVAASLAPAMFTSIHSLSTGKYLFINRKKCITIVVMYLLSFSSLGIFALFIGFLFLLIRRGFITAALLSGPVLLISSFLAYQNIEEFRDRVDGTIEIFRTGNIYDYKIHGSSFVLYNNYHVATTNFLKNPLFGTGLGSHSTAFEKYSLTNKIGAVEIEFNSSDANSMFLRLLSETGIFGIILFLGFFFRNYIPHKSAVREEYWIISVGCFLIILLYLIRQGHYFYNGFPFFIWLYYYTKQKNKEALNIDHELPSVQVSSIKS